MPRNGAATPATESASRTARSSPARGTLLVVPCLVAAVGLASTAAVLARQGETTGRAAAPANSETAQTSATCPGGICGELGNGFFLPDRDPVKGTLLNGKEFFKNRRLGVDSDQHRSCAQLTKIGESSRDFQSAESMEELTRNTMTEFGLKASFSSARPTAQTSVNVLTGFTSSVTTKVNSTTMDITIQRYAVTLRHNSDCYSVANVDPRYLAKFEALPMIDRSKVSALGSWTPYVEFMRTWGSHVMTEQRIGSRFQQWMSSTSSASDIQSTLKARACAKVEGVNPGKDATGKDKSGWSVDTCAGYNREARERARIAGVKEQQVVRGGSERTRDALLNGVTEESLKNFRQQRRGWRRGDSLRLQAGLATVLRPLPGAVRQGQPAGLRCVPEHAAGVQPAGGLRGMDRRRLSAGAGSARYRGPLSGYADRRYDGAGTQHLPVLAGQDGVPVAQRLLEG